MFHPDVELRYVSREIGYGLFATRFIATGTITWVMCALERVLDPAAYARMPAAYRPYLERYTYRNRDGSRILCCGVGRYLNHSCDSNTLTLPDAEFEVAVRDIGPGEQITTEYGTLNLATDLHCLCGSDACRRVIRRSDPDLLWTRWEQRVLESLARFADVPQPLQPFLRRTTLAIPDPAPSAQTLAG